ncbi:MAG: GDP-mannose 4,6 dehydratase, partial [Chloroflexota bacterium]|nr:GDP-mannose 4,6 dehydratase [Chloroflexota bacterium]
MSWRAFAEAFITLVVIMDPLGSAPIFITLTAGLSAGARRRAALEAAAAAGGLERFVHMSSTSVYGEAEQLPLPVREDVECHPSRGYGKAKWGAEQQVWAQV